LAKVVKFFKNGAETRRFFYFIITRTVGPRDYGPLSDEELTAIAAQTFALLEEEEARAQAR
jgi:hypothetical protein